LIEEGIIIVYFHKEDCDELGAMLFKFNQLLNRKLR